MSSKIFDALLNEKIDFFKNSFSNNSEIYFDSNRKLISPLEYGMYKEHACKEFLKFIIPSRYRIDDGFVINANEQITTQCDIVIYDSNNTPLFESGIKQRFFPMETVLAIGEVKSTLSKRELKNAINKLAKSKSIRKENQNPSIIYRKTTETFKEYNHPFDQIISFIICQKLKFKVTDIDFDTLYDKEIPVTDRHNMILSIEDGLFLYRHSINGEEKFWPFPYSQNQKLKNCRISPGDNQKNHFLNFAASLYQTTQLSTIFQPEFARYTIHSPGLFYKED
ncbi:hypothetical protein ASF10_22640 [Flavobacterium sp. Leaf82]|uniref:DUF6602 domain-containing protein n=1 Tax=Flavobacterium sp. Leaf82 TaxID=1736238 RepID=UPI0006FCEA1D|nr:DUF6602 domain-containing protein [Flavobacterium sp. Leaf82]KQO29075.1 hypothetical protein ASF10_22640 [Flavobacterium sp. Leaf82]